MAGSKATTALTSLERSCGADKSVVANVARSHRSRINTEAGQKDQEQKNKDKRKGERGRTGEVKGNGGSKRRRWRMSGSEKAKERR